MTKIKFALAALSLGLFINCGLVKSVFGKKEKAMEEDPSEFISVDQEAYLRELTAKKSDSPYETRVKNYIAQFAPIAVKEMKKYKIPASITLAQGILESGAGMGTLAIRSNNHFGIKCHNGWSGKTVTHDDDRLKECFRKYKHAEQSYEDHSKFLVERNRYAPLFKLDINDYKGWAKGLKLAGYATDPKYPDKLIRIIETYKLYIFDENGDKSVAALKAAAPAAKEAVAAVKTSPAAKKSDSEELIKKADAQIKETQAIVEGARKEAKPQKEIPAEAEETEEETDPETELTDDDPAESISTSNISKSVPKLKALTHTVQKGDTLYSLSKRYNTTVDAIMELNHLETPNIKIGNALLIPIDNAQ